MNQPLLFLGKFLRHGTAIASLAPSSPWLSRATVRNIDWERARSIVELGAGTGPITEVIAQSAHSEAQVVAIERDPDFVNVLKSRFGEVPNLSIVQGDICDLESILGAQSISSVDVVISGLPVPSFPKDLRESYFRSLRRLTTPTAVYHQITELPWVYLRFYRRYFENVRFVFEPRNIPPAGAYHCSGLRTLD